MMIPGKMLVIIPQEDREVVPCPFLSCPKSHCSCGLVVKLRLTRPWFSQFPEEMVKLGHHG
jgi:hypothetical protein